MTKRMILVALLFFLDGCLCTPKWLSHCAPTPQKLCPGVVVIDGAVVCTRPKTQEHPNPCQC